MTHSSPDSETLLPCPFCGSSDIESLKQLDFVSCQDCGASLEDSEPSARALWNRRTPAQPAGEPVACSACGHVHPKNANCIGVAVGAGGGVVRLSPIATPPQAGPCPYAEDGKECILEAHSIGPCLCANPVNAPPQPALTDVNDAMWKAYEAFEFIRLKLVNHLNEPERSAFWRAVEARRAIGNIIAAQPPTIDDVPSCGQENDYRRATPPQAAQWPCPYAQDGHGCILETQSIGPCLCADQVSRSQAVSMPPPVREAIIEQCAKLADGWILAHGKNELRYVSPRQYACDAVMDVADAIRALSRPQRCEGCDQNYADPPSKLCPGLPSLPGASTMTSAEREATPSVPGASAPAQRPRE